MKIDNMAGKLKTWSTTRTGLVLSAVVELVVAYIVVSRAIDTGSWWEYLITFVLIVAAVNAIINVFNKKK